MFARLHAPLAALALLALGAPLSGAPSSGASSTPVRSEPASADRSFRLAARYHVRLVSAWPQLPAGAGCENGGTETLDGTIARTGASDYAGTFTRTTHLLFCGAHGAGGDACTLTLDGRGAVAVRGTVVGDDRAPGGRALRLAWTPDPAHGAEVSGECADEFKEKVERMYLTVRHGVEFAVPNDGAAPRRERLEDYPWIVEVD